LRLQGSRGSALPSFSQRERGFLSRQPAANEINYFERERAQFSL